MFFLPLKKFFYEKPSIVVHNTTQHNTTQHNTTTSKLFKLLLLMCIAILQAGQGKAQFINPTYSQTLYPSPVTSGDYLNNFQTKYISNHSSDVSPVSGFGIDVIAWTFDEMTGGGMIAAGSHQVSPVSQPFVGDATIAVPDAVDIRVAYMDPFIVAVYYDINLSQYVLAKYTYTIGSGIINHIAPNIILPTTVPPSQYERISLDINMDANAGAVVYSSGGIVQGFGIQVSGGVLTTSSLTIPYDFSTGSNNIEPDVVFVRQYFPPLVVDNVMVTYHNTSSGQNYVYYEDFSNFYVGAGIRAFVDNFTLPGGVTRVNIDAHNDAASVIMKWAYTYSDGNAIFVHGQDQTGFVYTLIANDGSLTSSPPDITLHNNIAPVISFRHDYNIQLAWASDAMLSYMLSPLYTQNYIGIIIDPLNLSVVSGNDYTLIDNVNTAEYVTARPLIAINRHPIVGNRLVSFGTDDLSAGYELKHKNVEELQSFYRRSDPNAALVNNGSEIIKLYPNPFNSHLIVQIPQSLNNQIVKISVQDLLGRQIAQYEGVDAKSFLYHSSNSWQNGHYMVRIENKEIEPLIVKVMKQ